MLIIPAIDIMDSKVVRLTKGDYGNKKEYAVSPVEQAGIFFENGFSHLHIVDLSGSKDGSASVLHLIELIKKRCNVTIQLGGGIRKYIDVVKANNCGADKIIIGSLALTDPKEFEKIISSFPIEKIIIAADSLNNEIMIRGWTESSGVNIYKHIEYCSQLGLNDFLCTDIGKDGMLQGVSIDLYANILKKYPHINLIASGGISCLQDIQELKSLGIYAVVVGKAYYENKIGIKELKYIAD